MCTKSLNEKPADVTSETTGKLVGLCGFSLRFSWPDSKRAAMRCLMAVWSSPRGHGCWERGWICPLLPNRFTNTTPGRWWMKQAGALFMGAESAPPVILCTAQWMPLHGGEEKKTTSDIEMNCMLVIVLLDLGSNHRASYGHPRGGSRSDHQNYPGLFCSFNHILRCFMSKALRHLMSVKAFYDRSLRKGTATEKQVFTNCCAF